MANKDTQTVYVAKEFTPYPSGRYRDDGKYSGEVFRDDVLLTKIKEHDKIRVCIDDVGTLPSSFWEETWGGMVRMGMSVEEIEKKFDVYTTESELIEYVELFRKFIREARSEV